MITAILNIFIRRDVSQLLKKETPLCKKLLHAENYSGFWGSDLTLTILGFLLQLKPK